MPIHWTIDSRAKIMVATGDGPVDLDEVNRMLDMIAGSNILGYRKLFDGRLARTDMEPEHLLTVGVRLRSMHEAAGSGLGPLALVVRDENYWQMARLLGILAVPKRPMRVFKQADKARLWLDSPAILASTPA